MLKEKKKLGRKPNGGADCDYAENWTTLFIAKEEDENHRFFNHPQLEIQMLVFYAK